MKELTIEQKARAYNEALERAKIWQDHLNESGDEDYEEEDENNSLGFYKGIMKMIAPELYSNDDTFKGDMNVLDFNWAEDREQDNAFPVVAKLKK